MWAGLSSFSTEISKKIVALGRAFWYIVYQSTFAGLGISRFFLSLRFSALLPLVSLHPVNGQVDRTNGAFAVVPREKSFAQRPKFGRLGGDSSLWEPSEPRIVYRWCTISHAEIVNLSEERTFFRIRGLRGSEILQIEKIVH